MDPEQSGGASVSAASPTRISVEAFVDGLKQIAEGVITKSVLMEYMTGFEIDPAGLERYKLWKPDRHTRNLIFRNDMIELMAICWNIGNTTPLHTHNGQLGWMAMVEGQLMVENFRKVECDKPENQQVVGIDCIAGATSIKMERLEVEFVRPGGPLNTVDKVQTIHRISNLAEWKQRAVSLHVYSRPIDSCVVFDLENQTCYRRDLSYDSKP